MDTTIIISKKINIILKVVYPSLIQMVLLRDLIEKVKHLNVAVTFLKIGTNFLLEYY